MSFSSVLLILYALIAFIMIIFVIFQRSEGGVLGLGNKQNFNIKVSKDPSLRIMSVLAVLFFGGALMLSVVFRYTATSPSQLRQFDSVLATPTQEPTPSTSTNSTQEQELPASKTTK